MRTYRELLADPTVRTIYLVGLLVRIPLAGQAVVLTLHVVSSLGASYSAAGIVVAVLTVFGAVAQPWRGRLVDRIGMRRTLLPSLLALPVLWAVAPFVGYWPLLGMCVVAGLLTIPSFAILRQAIMAAIPARRRRAALSLDSMLVELSFMIGPAAGVLVATSWGTRPALLIFQLAGVAGCVALYVLDPRLTGEPDDDEPTTAGHRWMTPRVWGLLGIMAAATFVLGGTDVALVAGLREMGHETAIGWVMTLWCAGSLVGAFVYGALHRPIHPALLLLGLAVTTAPAALSASPWSMALWLVLAGVCCAPTIASSVDYLSRAVPAARRGEAMGWHGGMGTVGSAIGAPLVGAIIDVEGWRVAFVVAAASGAVLALAAMAVLARRRRRVIA